MSGKLTPLIGDSTTVTILGLSAHAGKTNTLRHLLKELQGEPLALTSVGRDGERGEVVTGTEKQGIWVRENTLFATARGLLPQCDCTLAVEAVTDVMTPLGAVGIFRSLSQGYVQLAGPSAVHQLAPLTQQFHALGAKRVLVNGAMGRTSLAGGQNQGCALLCVGASLEGGLPALVRQTAHCCQLFASPPPTNPALAEAFAQCEARFALFTPEGEAVPLPVEDSGQPAWRNLPREPLVLWVQGGVTSNLLRTLARRGVAITVASQDATHFLQDQASNQLFYRSGGGFLVAQPISLVGVLVNPWSHLGRHLDSQTLVSALVQEVSVAVLDLGYL